MPSQYAYFQKQFVPLPEAKIGIMTHAFNYGTACFEGVRGNWNEDEGQIYLFRPEDHFRRLAKSCRILKLDLELSTRELLDITLKLVEMCGYKEDIYIRPMVYKSSEEVGVRLHNLQSDFLLFVTPFGPYLDVTKGIKCCVSSWRRVDDNSIPARAKVTGLYVNSALVKTEAWENGFDEGIMLNQDGHVSEGSGENLFLVEGNRLITPPVYDNILVGITRETVMALAKNELGMETVERTIDRSELYIADECFLTGTAAHVSPVTEIDHRPVGSGEIGPISGKIQSLYFDVLKGKNPKYMDWCKPAYSRQFDKLPTGL
ncbi:MAG: branched-chain amino acid transaminase [Dehalococcoidia bacterium]|nr:branched-chain amino acid transaminase [Dehalococcoidia bacterium]